LFAGVMAKADPIQNKVEDQAPIGKPRPSRRPGRCLAGRVSPRLPATQPAGRGSR
jgi:hypothetical protein